jgi:hypothetical protein
MFNAELVTPMVESFFFDNYPPEKILLMIKNGTDIVGDLNAIGQKKPALLKNMMIIMNNWGHDITSDTLVKSNNGNERRRTYQLILQSQIGNKWVTRQLKILKAYTRVYCQQNGIH